MTDYAVTRHGEWQIATAASINGGFVAWAKKGTIVGPNALFEPGDDVYFEFADSPEEARRKLVEEIAAIGWVRKR